ncbi:MAG: hypothetical protein SF123_11085 [Chloroflexota bacterium]|nr:hypothetical protein [Chloroflexota bacterium]
MKNRMVFTLICIVLLIFVTTSVYGQTDQAVAYLLFEDQENYYIRQVSFDDSNIQDVLILPRATSIQFGVVVPETEIAELRNYIQVIDQPATLSQWS